MTTTYYEDDHVTIYHGDCRDLLDLPNVAAVDAVVTDPPYGIQADRRQANRAGKRHGRAVAPSRDYGTTGWDDTPADPATITRLLQIGTQHVIWGGNYYPLPPSPAWLIWDKETGTNGYADAELAWTDLHQAARLKRHRWMGMLQATRETRFHPTQKPLQVMTWTLGFTTGAVLDPFMGSGTTLRAAKDLGRHAIGIEFEERYCEIAAKRCAQEVLDFGGAA